MAKHPTHFELSPSLLDASDDRAVAVLAAYYHPLSGGGGGYTGGQFDAFDPSGTRSASANTYTADDLVAVTLLSVEVPGRAARRCWCCSADVSRFSWRALPLTGTWQTKHP